MEINRPDVLAEVTARFLDYERAINENDIRALDGSRRFAARAIPSARGASWCGSRRPG